MRVICPDPSTPFGDFTPQRRSASFENGRTIPHWPKRAVGVSAVGRAYNSVRHDVSHRLREMRQARGLTLEQLAELVDMTYQTVQRYETGARKLRVDDLPRFAEALDCEPADLVAGKQIAPDEYEALALFRKLNQEDRRRLLIQMGALADHAA